MIFRRLACVVKCHARRSFSSTVVGTAEGHQDALIALCKHRGFIFPAADIYGGMTTSFAYGPLGVLLKKNIADLWWKDFVSDREDCVGLESPLLLHPQGIGQSGKSFRNEISPGNFLYRLREFEQMELQYFIHPSDAQRSFHYWVSFCRDWLLKLGIRNSSMRLHEYPTNELAHYAESTTDIEFKFPFGWGELWGIANRSDFDLKRHAVESKRDLSYVDSVTRDKFYPYVIEPAVGLDRLFFAFLSDAYRIERIPHKDANSSAGSTGSNGNANNNVEKEDQEAGGGESTRVVLRLSPLLSPYKYAIMPLMKKDELVHSAKSIFDKLKKHCSVDFDVSGSIGKRYRRQDEIGTPACVTVDFDSLEDQMVTVRDRDSMHQKRVSIDVFIQSATSMSTPSLRVV